jgi:hypothetical protein
MALTIDIDPDVHAQLAAAAAAAAKAGGRAVSYCDVIRRLLDQASRSGLNEHAQLTVAL